MLHIRRKKAGLLVLLLLSVLWLSVVCCSLLKELDSVQAAQIEEKVPVLIIDPGHGGSDGGACGLHDTVESSVNWNIAARLRDTAQFLGIHTVMTRETEEIRYPADCVTISAQKKWDTRQRVEKINSVPHAVLLSIHQNFYPAESPCGAEVLYGKVGKSQYFGEIIQNNMANTLDPGNRRVAVPARENIYIMQHVQCPAVLVECGFLSNERESGLLCTDAYRISIAAILAASFLQGMEDLAL